MTEKLKIYVNRDLASEQIPVAALLYPFFESQKRNYRGSPSLGLVFEHYGFDTEYYTVVDRIGDADITMLPYPYWTLRARRPHLLRSIVAAAVEEARNHKKLLLIDAYGDPMDAIDVPDIIVLRSGYYRSKIKEHEIIVPMYADDLLERSAGGALLIRPKTDHPRVGFSGWAEVSWRSHFRSSAKDALLRAAANVHGSYGDRRKGVFIRREAMAILERGSGIGTNFIKRTAYSGHRESAEKDFETIRREFVDNILTSDYILDVRGDCNASTRFYEILSLGSLPLYVDTDRVLPLEDLISYRKLFPIVPYRDISKIEAILLDFHRSLTEGEYQDHQREARRIFAEYLRIDRFTKHLMERIRRMAERHKNI